MDRSKNLPEEEEVSLSGIVRQLAEVLTGEAILGAVDSVKESAEEGARRAIKASVLYVMFMIGMIFLLVGLSSYLQARFVWMEGMGLIVVGVVVILLGFFAKAMK